MHFGAKSHRGAGLRLADDDEGTIMIDALVAVVIISLMIAMCSTTIHIAVHAWRNSRQTRQAQATLAALIDSTPRTAGQYTGVRDGFRYKVEVGEQKTLFSRYCTLHAEVMVGRTFSLDAARWCDRTGAVG